MVIRSASNGQRFRCPRKSTPKNRDPEAVGPKNGRCSHLRSSMTGWPFGYPIGTKAEFRSCFEWPSFWVSHQQLPPTPGSDHLVSSQYPGFPVSRKRRVKVGRDPPDPGHWDRRWCHDQVDLPQHRAVVRCFGDGVGPDDSGHVGHVGPKSCTQIWLCPNWWILQFLPKFMDSTSWTFYSDYFSDLTWFNCPGASTPVEDRASWSGVESCGNLHRFPKLYPKSP